MDTTATYNYTIHQLLIVNHEIVVFLSKTPVTSTDAIQEMQHLVTLLSRTSCHSDARKQLGNRKPIGKAHSTPKQVCFVLIVLI